MIKQLRVIAPLFLIVLPFVHPFGPVRKQFPPSAAPEFPLLEKACMNCHSENTVWPSYSYLPVVSWALERDVKDAREQMNLSYWQEYSGDRKRDLLARIAAQVRTGGMPPARYKLLHPEARLSETQRQAIYVWTKQERKLLRTTTNLNTPSNSSTFPE